AKRFEDLLRARQWCDADRVSSGPLPGPLGAIDQHRGLSRPKRLAGGPGAERLDSGGTAGFPGRNPPKRLDERRRIDPGSHRIGIEKEGVLVAMLTQAGGPGQERRVAEALGVFAQNRRDSVIGLPVSIPVSPLEELREGVELAPGGRWLELDTRRPGGV